MIISQLPSMKFFQKLNNGKKMKKCIDCNEKIKNFYANRCKKCHFKWRNLKPKNNPNWKGGRPKCKKCKIQISYTKKMCWKCYAKTLQGRGNPMYGRIRSGKKSPSYIDGRTNKTYYCKECNKIITYKTWKYGAVFCKSCAKKGKRSVNYIHGLG